MKRGFAFDCLRSGCRLAAVFVVKLITRSRFGCLRQSGEMAPSPGRSVSSHGPDSNSAKKFQPIRSDEVSGTARVWDSRAPTGEAGLKTIPKSRSSIARKHYVRVRFSCTENGPLAKAVRCRTVRFGTTFQRGIVLQSATERNVSCLKKSSAPRQPKPEPLHDPPEPPAR